jgi:hypothetical protein
MKAGKYVCFLQELFRNGYNRELYVEHSIFLVTTVNTRKEVKEAELLPVVAAAVVMQQKFSM